MVPFSGFLAVSTQDASFWEKLVEKWGIGLIGMALFILLARWTAHREETAQLARDAREAADHAERIALATRNNDLMEQVIKESKDHSLRLEKIIESGNSSNAQIAREMSHISQLVSSRCPKS